MKLAEALQERADLVRKINQIRSRLTNNVLIQEGEKPAEDPYELLDELEKSIANYEVLISRINLTNCNTVVKGKTLTELLALKDALTLKAAAYREVIDEGSRNTDRARHTEIKILSSVNVASLQKKYDQIAKELRMVDNSIQETNWNTELL